MDNTQAQIEEALTRMAAELDTLRGLARRTVASPLPERESSKMMLTVEDAADRLSISRSALFVLIRDGELDSVKVGSRRRIPVASLQKYVLRLVGSRGAA